MPANPVSVTVVIQGLQPRANAEGVPVIFAHDSTDSATNLFKTYTDAATLSIVHGKTTKTGVSGQTQFNQRAPQVVTCKPVKNAIVGEALGNAQTGTLAQKPLTNTTPPVIVRDSTTHTVVGTYQSPITDTPAAGEVLINFYTGEYKFPGVGSTASTAGYSYFDFTGFINGYLAQKPKIGPLTFLVVPDMEGTALNYGDIRKLAELSRTYYLFMVTEMPTATLVAADKLLRAAINNAHWMAVKSKDTAIDLASAIAGIGSRTNAFTTLAYKEIRGINTDYFLPSEIGNVETADTFEGEAINIVHRYGNKDTLGNERTGIVYAGSTTDDKDEIYASRVLAKIALKNRQENAIANLLVREGVKIGNDTKGVAAVHTELVKSMEDSVSDNEITKDYVVSDPVVGPNQFSDSAASAKRRKIGPWITRGKMVESAHEIVVNSYLEVA